MSRGARRPGEELLRAVETLYDFAPDDAAWVAAVRTSVAPLLPPSERGWVAWMDIRRRGAGVKHFATVGLSAPLAAALAQFAHGAVPWLSQLLFGGPGGYRQLDEVIRPRRSDDAVTRDRKRAWSAASLPTAVALGVPLSAGPRAALRAAARAIDAARSRRDEDAIDGWRALCDGRWSLLDTFDTDGRRYFVARPNAPDVAEPRSLTKLERAVSAFIARGESSKAIGYLLGLSTSRVDAAAASAVRKLRLRSRAELATLGSLAG